MFPILVYHVGHVPWEALGFNRNSLLWAGSLDSRHRKVFARLNPFPQGGPAPKEIVLTKYQQHPLGAAFPEMSPEDYQALKDSIEDIGVQNPITLFEGMVIDGWHRYKAASELLMDCPSIELDDVDPVDFVWAQNRPRRHLPLSAWALIEVSLAKWRSAGRPNTALSAGFPKTDGNTALSAGFPKTTAEMANAVGAKERTIYQAKTVHEHAAPEVVEAVKRGDIGLPKAAAIAKLPKNEQAAAIAKPLPKPAKPAPSAAPVSADAGDAPECFEPDEAELAALHAEDQKQIEALLRIAEADDKLKQALDENRLLLAKCRAAEAARDTAQRQAEQFRKDMLAWKRRAERAERQAT